MPNFESFSRQLIAHSAEPLLTVRKHGVIALNTTAYRALLEPVAVTLHFDRTRRMMSLTRVDHRHEHAHFVRPASRTGAPPYLVSAISFLRAHGILAATSLRCDAVVENGILYGMLDTTTATVAGTIRGVVTELPAAVRAEPAYAVIVS